MILLAVVATFALPSAATTAKPAADFVVTPSAPSEGLPASYVAVLSSGDRRLTVEWDFDGDPGGVFETKGASVAHVYATPGEKQVSMRVVKKDEIEAVVTKTIFVTPQAGSSPGLPSPIAPQPNAPDPGLIGPPSLMTPFPVVRIAGQLLPWGARVRLLAVTAPPGAVVTASLPRRRLSAAIAPPASAQPACSPAGARAPPCRGNPVGDTRAPARIRRQVHPLSNPGQDPAARQGRSLPASGPPSASRLFVRIDAQNCTFFTASLILPMITSPSSLPSPVRKPFIAATTPAITSATSRISATYSTVP